MISNVNVLDRIIRVILGAVLIAWATLYPNMTYAWIGWIGVIPLATGLYGWCGLYSLFGLSTISKSG